ncbi:MAG TPA: sigma-70 family RNA polymerase sigma factor [Polyangiaceae bacterium]|nr:sigma-70 family RNA polymerase sigma factor [Polyangiaceae bacterium]
MTPRPTPLASRVEGLLRELAPVALGALMRRFRDFGAAEDAVQEALLAAATQWPRDGLPDSPRAWLVGVASRRLLDHLRSEAARRRREDAAGAEQDREHAFAPAPGEDAGEKDDALVLLFMCCHPALTPPSAIALTLRAVGGLTTAEIAKAFLVPEATMAQRISRAKQTVQASGVGFAMPSAEEWLPRWRAVLHVLYLMFNEGYAASAGADLQRADLAAEAVRLTRAAHALRPEDGEARGLLALMLLTDARRSARATAEGDLVPLEEQDRALWDRAAIAEGVALVSAALSAGSIGVYQLQAAVAAIHDEAPDAASTDWPQILALYTLLERMADNPMVTLNRAIALAMVHGPRAGLERLEALAASGKLAHNHRLDAVRGHLHERAGDRQAAVAHYRAAAALTTSLPEQRYLLARAARLADQ